MPERSSSMSDRDGSQLTVSQNTSFLLSAGNNGFGVNNYVPTNQISLTSSK